MLAIPPASGDHSVTAGGFVYLAAADLIRNYRKAAVSEAWLSRRV